MIEGGRDLDDREKLAWLRLIRSENVGPRTFKTLLDRFKSAEAALDALPALVKKASSRAIRICSLADAESEWNRAKKLNIRFVALSEPAYPKALRNIDAPPPILAVAGRLEVLDRPIVGVVGSRNASASGLVFTDRLTRGLAAAGYVVASGLARGIDVKAHLGSIETGTIAVLAGGHDHIYPSEHEGLARRICEAGALITEMPIGWEPRARDFPRRNRIVAGLSLGVVVVEASRRSGSLITARFANEQGREVFAVPGSPLDPRAEGTNDLIRQGATLCTSADDVIAGLAPIREGGPEALGESPRFEPDVEPLWDELDLFAEAPPMPEEPSRLMASKQGTEAESRGTTHATLQSLAEPARPPYAESAEADTRGRVLALLGPTPMPVDELIRASGVMPRVVIAALTELEIEGAAIRLDGNRVALRLR